VPPPPEAAHREDAAATAPAGPGGPPHAAAAVAAPAGGAASSAVRAEGEVPAPGGGGAGTAPRGAPESRGGSRARFVGVDVVHAAPGGAAAPSGVAAVRWPAAAGWAAVLAGTTGQLLVYGPATQGLSPGHVRDRGLLAATLSTHVGHTLVARLMLLALTAAVGEQILRHRRAGAAGAVPLALLLALTWSEISHAPGEPLAPLSVLVTTLHVTAMAVWAGGVATLALLLVRHRGPETAATARRFTRFALAAVAVLAATGTYQAWRLLGGFGDLTGTRYGRLLLLKVGLVAAVLAVAALRRARAAAPTRSVLAELAGLTAVLVVTVLLTSTAPASRPAGATGTTGAAPTAGTTATPGPAPTGPTGRTDPTA
jgi:copper transport protein